MEQRIGDAEYQLTIARAAISKPENWCQGSFQLGQAFCASGILRAMQSLGNPYLYYQDTRAFRLLAREVFKTGQDIVSRFNDTHTHAEVLAVYDAAIAEAHRLGV